jgi:GGDEF domain-containing protein
VGERMGVMGALSAEAAVRCLNAREVDGIAIGEGLNARTLDALLVVLGEDVRFRELPVGALGPGPMPEALPNFLRASDAQVLVERMLPLVQLRAFEGRLKRMLASIERKGMLDPNTGLLYGDAFGRDLTRAIQDAIERGSALSIARFSFEYAMDRRSSMDAARLVSRLMRNVDFACRQADGSIIAVFTETDLRSAHVVARRLAVVLKHTMLRPGGEQQPVSPNVTLATLKATDTVLTLMARIAPRAVAAE